MNPYPQNPYPQNPYPQYPQAPAGYAPQGAPLPPANSLDSVLDGVDTGEKAGGSSRLPRIPIGNHVLLIDYYGAWQTRNDGLAVEGEFIIESSDTQAPGTRYNVGWFPNAQKVDRQKFERGRIAAFCKSVDDSLGLPVRSTKEVGRDLVTGPGGEAAKGRGLKVRCSAWQKTDKKTGMPMTSKSGPILDYAWQGIPGQSFETAAATAAKMPAQMPRKQAGAAQPQYAPPSPPPPPPNPYAAPPAGFPGAPPMPQAPPPQAYTANPYGAPQGAPTQNFVAGLRG